MQEERIVQATVLVSAAKQVAVMRLAYRLVTITAFVTVGKVALIVLETVIFGLIGHLAL